MNNQFKNIPLSDIEVNVGQIPGVPENQRKNTTDDIIQKTVDSIIQDPEMLELRGLLVYPFNGKYIAIGGNTRLMALRRLNYKDVPCAIIPKDTPAETIKRYIVKDNASFGDWVWDKLTSGWDIDELESWAIEVPRFDDTEQDEPSKRPGWNAGKDATESLCDFADRVSYHVHGEYSFISFYKKSDAGFPLSQIKADFNNTKVFANKAIEVLHKLVGLHHLPGWCIITTPKRRHKEQNFASATAEIIAKRLNLPFYDNVITAKNRTRVNPVFNLEYTFEEPNVIIFDDILTTGSTLGACRKLLADKNCIFLVGINNN